MCFEAPLSISHVSSPGVTDPDNAENNTYSSASSSFACFLRGPSSSSSPSSLARCAWCILLFFFLQWTISGNVSYLVTIVTLKLGVVFCLIVLFSPLEPLGRSRLLVDFLLEVRLLIPLLIWVARAWSHSLSRDSLLDNLASSWCNIPIQCQTSCFPFWHT